MKKTWFIISITVISLAGIWGYLNYDPSSREADDITLNSQHDVRDDGNFDITVSFYPLQFIAENITGDLASVYNISKGRDPHDYQLTNRDLLSMQRADLVVLQGLDFEPWGIDATEQLNEAGVPYILATNNLDLIELGENNSEEDDHRDEHGHGNYDPHTWLDPLLMIDKVSLLAESISTLDPENAATYQQNADDLIKELEQLHADYQTTLNQCSVSESIVSHDAFGYLAKRYNLDMHPIAGISTNDTPSAKLLAELRVKSTEGVTAILSETSSVTEYAETISRDTGLDIIPINTIAYNISEDNNYITLMKNNLNALASAYDCN